MLFTWVPFERKSPLRGVQGAGAPCLRGVGCATTPHIRTYGEAFFCLTAVSSPNPSFMRGFCVGYERVPHTPRQGGGRPPLTPRRGRFPNIFLFQKRITLYAVFPLEIRFLGTEQGAKSPLLGEGFIHRICFFSLSWKPFIMVSL